MSDTTTKELHVCMGLNSCKDQGYSGKNDCAGKGDCSTAVGHPCHTLNDCKGQGGCGIFGTTEELCYPGQNDCKYQGSCGVPILASRFLCQGPNKGRSVWLLARARFEERRTAAGQPFGEAPAQFGPSNAYVNELRGTHGVNYSSCGNSGSRACSYINDTKAREEAMTLRVRAMQEDSARNLHNSLATCPPKDDA